VPATVVSGALVTRRWRVDKTRAPRGRGARRFRSLAERALGLGSRSRHIGGRSPTRRPTRRRANPRLVRIAQGMVGEIAGRSSKKDDKPHAGDEADDASQSGDDATRSRRPPPPLRPLRNPAAKGARAARPPAASPPRRASRSRDGARLELPKSNRRARRAHLRWVLAKSGRARDRRRRSSSARREPFERSSTCAPARIEASSASCAIV